MEGLNIQQGFRREDDFDDQKHTSFALYRPRFQPTISGMASDLRKFSPSKHRQNQLQTSTCVANATVRALEIKRVQRFYDQAKASGKNESESLDEAFKNHIDLSRLALYFAARDLMDPPETDKDQGTIVSLAAAALKMRGVCTEAEWPFLSENLFVPPTWMAMRTAFVHKISGYCKIYSTGEDRVQDVIASLSVGNPVVYGTTIDHQWSNYDGSKPLGLVNGPELGGHSTILIGYDPVKNVFIGENSWGNFWGLEGFYEMKPEVISSQDSSDFVVIFGSWQQMEINK